MRKNTTAGGPVLTLLVIFSFAAASSSDCSGPWGELFFDTDGNPSLGVNARGGGIIKEGGRFHLHGQYYVDGDNNFNGFSMYSSDNMAYWKSEGIILPQQPSGELGPNRKGDKPHVIKCPATSEFVLFAHAASTDTTTDNEIVYATSNVVNGTYSYKGVLKNANGVAAQQSDVNVVVDGTTVYVVADGGNVYTLASDCHSWVSHATYPSIDANSDGALAPVVIKVNDTFFWITSKVTASVVSQVYSTAPVMSGPWTNQGVLSGADRTQGSWIQPIVGCQATAYIFVRGNGQLTYQMLTFNGTSISVKRIVDLLWDISIGSGTWELHNATPPPQPIGGVPRWGQCGGILYEGPTRCSEGKCVKLGDYYWQCQ